MKRVLSDVVVVAVAVVFWVFWSVLIWMFFHPPWQTAEPVKHHQCITEDDCPWLGPEWP